MATTYTAAEVSAAYNAIVRAEPPGGSTGAYAQSVAAQLNQGLLTFGNFESSLLTSDLVMYTTLPALVTIDAFYNATPSSAILTSVASNASPSGFYSGLELHNEGYSDANVWTILGSQWGADTSSNFFTLYNGQATGNISDYTTFINEVYLRIYGSLPTAANLQNLLNDIPGVEQLLSGGGHAATAIQVMGGLFGYLLYAGQSNGVGAYTPQANAFLADAATDEATSPGSSASLYGPGPELIKTNPAGIVVSPTSVTLMTTAENLTATNIYGSLTPFNINGIGPTLVSGDVLTGSPGTTTNTLTVTDGYASGLDAIPAGISVSNIQDIILQTTGNAGNGGAPWDTSPFTSVVQSTVTSAGSKTDTVNAGSATNVTVTHSNVGGAVTLGGGQNDTVTTSGTGRAIVGNLNIAVSVPNAANLPTGTVSVTENNSAGGSVQVYGGTSVTVNVTANSNSGTINIGNTATNTGDVKTGGATNPTGVITVNDAATAAGANGGAVNVFGGVGTGTTPAVTVTAAGDLVQVGDTSAAAIASNFPSGDVVVSNTSATVWSANAGFEEDSNVVGGVNVTVTSDTGKIQVGDYSNRLNSTGTGALAGTQPTGNVTATNSATNNGASVTIDGGVNATATAAGGAVTFGLVNGTVVLAPTGTEAVTDISATPYDKVINATNETVALLGGTTASASSNVGAVTVGNNSGLAGTNPSGAIQITDTAGYALPSSVTSAADGTGNSGNDSANAFGGTTVTVSATDGSVTIGTAANTPGTEASGAITVTQSAIETGGEFTDTIAVYGGNGISITTTGAASVIAGANAAPVAGAVSITDTFDLTTVSGTSFAGSATNTTFTVVGGSTVSIITVPTSGNIVVGGPTAALLNAAGTGLANPGDYASGAVTITNEYGSGKAALFGTSNTTVNVYGSTSVTVNGGGATTITDEATTLATHGSGAGLPIGASSLNTVVLDGLSGNATVTTNVASLALSVFDNSTAGELVATTDTTANTLALTVGSETKALSITDNSGKTTAVTVTDAATLAGNAAASTSAGVVTLNTPAATSITFSNTAAQWFAVNDAKLTSVVANNTGSLNIASINDASVSFNGSGGTANQTIGITSNSLGTGVSLTGGSGTNTLVANYNAAAADNPLGSNSHIKGFTTLQLGAGVSSDVHGGVYQPTVTAQAEVWKFTVTTAAAATTYSVAITGNLPVSYTAGGGDTVATIAAHLAGELVSEGITGYAIAYSAGSALFTVTSQTPGTAFTLTTDATGDDTATVTTPNVAAVVGDAYYDASGFTNLIVGATGNDVTLRNVAASTALTINASPGGTVNYLVVPTATGATLPLTVGSSATAYTAVNALLSLETLATVSGSVSTLNITSTGSGLNTLTIGDTSAKSIVVSGAQNLMLTLDTDSLAAFAGASSVGLINASAATGAVNVLGVPVSASSLTATGGGGLLTVAGSTTPAANDSYIAGSGGMAITLGAGGSWSATAPAGTGGFFGAYSPGSETVNLSASTASDTLKIADNVISTVNSSVGGVTGFHAVASSAADKLSYTAPVQKNVIANVPSSGVGSNASIISLTNAPTMALALDPTGALASALADFHYSAANGVITFVGNGTNQVPSNVGELIDAAEIIVAENANSIAMLTAGGATYVVSSDNTDALFGETKNAANPGNTNGSSVIELIGVAGNGFASSVNLAGTVSTGVGAAGAIAANVANVNAASTIAGATHVSGAAGSAAVVYNDTGYSLDTLTAANGASATGTTTFGNLAPAAELIINGGGTALGGVIVSQTGAAGSNSLIVDLQAADTVTSLSTSGDWNVTLLTDNGGPATITSLADTGGSMTTLTISGTGGLTIGGITGSALTTINAGGDSGALTLGSLASPLAQPGLSITGATGGDTISANGNSDSVTVGHWANNTTGGMAAALTSAVSITLGGSNDHVTLADYTGGGTNVIQATGASDTIQVEAGTNVIASLVTGGIPQGSLGAGATVNLLDPGTGNGNTVNDTVWIGGNSLVSLNGNTGEPTVGAALTDTHFGTNGAGATANIWVTGDLTGTTSANIVAGTASAAGTGLTTINGAASVGASGHLNITFDNANGSGVALTEALAGGTVANSFVNTQAATSLGNALDIAATQAAVLNFQLGAHSATVVTNSVLLQNANTGLIDWFQFGGNTYIVEANNAASVATAHSGLGTGDAVVELVGLVNLNTAGSFAGHALHAF